MTAGRRVDFISQQRIAGTYMGGRRSEMWMCGWREERRSHKTITVTERSDEIR